MLGAFSTLLLMSMAMFVASMFFASIPLMCKLSKDHLNKVTVFGAGVLVGTALVIIIPEGVHMLLACEPAAAAVLSTAAEATVRGGGGVGGVHGAASAVASAAAAGIGSAAVTAAENGAAATTTLDGAAAVAAAAAAAGVGDAAMMTTPVPLLDGTEGHEHEDGSRLRRRQRRRRLVGDLAVEADAGGIASDSHHARHIAAHSQGHGTDEMHGHAHGTHGGGDGGAHTDKVRLIGWALTLGFLSQLLVDRVSGGQGHGHGHNHRHDEDDLGPNHNSNVLPDGTVMPSSACEDSGGRGGGGGGGGGGAGGSSSLWSGASGSALVGLVVHSAADGIALGASSYSHSGPIEFMVFMAIMLHKAPASFGLSSFLIGAGLEQKDAMHRLLIFAGAAPAMAVVTYFCLGLGVFEHSRTSVALCLLFSAGTFLYVATAHVLPEIMNIEKSGRLLPWRVVVCACVCVRVCVRVRACMRAW